MTRAQEILRLKRQSSKSQETKKILKRAPNFTRTELGKIPVVKPLGGLSEPVKRKPVVQQEASKPVQPTHESPQEDSPVLRQAIPVKVSRTLEVQDSTPPEKILKKDLHSEEVPRIRSLKNARSVVDFSGNAAECSANS